MNKNSLVKDLNIYWIGGSPCSGKSSIAEMIVKRHNFNYYKCDDFMSEHLKNSKADLHPTMHKLSKMSWNEVFMQPLELQVKEEFEYYREEFKMILSDLFFFKNSNPIVAEGTALLPELLQQIAVDESRVVYMVPSEEFQLSNYKRREWINYILKECEDPQKAFDNWMSRDVRFAQGVLQKAKELGFDTIVVDGQTPLEENLNKVETKFGLQ